APPTVSNISSTTATAGDQTTINGSRFGFAQGAGQVWLRHPPRVGVRWSNKTNIPTGASRSTPREGHGFPNAALSKPLPPTVLTPNITSISQAGNQVTITGSNFGATRANGQVWLGTAYGLVQTWSSGQIVAQVAAGSSSGKVQVLQNGVWSNALPLTTSTL